VHADEVRCRAFVVGKRRVDVALAALAALTVSALLVACQDDYPLEPTGCDRWCYATSRLVCNSHRPAECVASCEAQGLTRYPECRPAFEAAVECAQAFEGNDDCSLLVRNNTPGRSCGPEISALISCVTMMTDGDGTLSR
jgi:hypothetical protein